MPTHFKKDSAKGIIDIKNTQISHVLYSVNLRNDIGRKQCTFACVVVRGGKGYWLRVTGYGLLVTGYWLLVTG